MLHTITTLPNQRDIMRQHIATVHCELGNFLFPECIKCEVDYGLCDMNEIELIAHSFSAAMILQG